MKMRFSLRVAFILLTLLCVWLGTTVHTANRQRRLVAWITKSGGRGVYEFQAPKWPSNSPPREPNGPDWLRDLMGIDFFERLTIVYMADTNTTNIAPLRSLKYLRCLDLGGTDVDDATPLSRLRRLKELYLGRTEMVDLSPLSKLDSLTFLDLNSTDVCDVSPLSDCPLEYLNLRYTEVRDVAPLAQIKNLEYLDISDTLVPEESYRKLENELPNCRISWTANRVN